MKKKIISIIICTLFILTIFPVTQAFFVNEMETSSININAGREDFPVDSWHNEIVLKTGIEEYPEAFISYDNKIIYADETYYKNPYNSPLKTELILRSIDDVNALETRQIYGTILNIDGEIPYYDLTNIRIFTLETYHGKLFVGITASDPYENPNSPHQEPGINDEYRRRVYVTSSVEEGNLLSNPHYDSTLGGLKNLNIDIIKPLPPYIIGGTGMQSPTQCNIQFRTAENEESLNSATWSEPYEENSIINIPINHKYIQYSISMRTDDSSLTPIVKKVEVAEINGDIIFSDISWARSDDYQSKEGISGTLSKGELVLENLLVEPAQVQFSYLFQAPSKQKPPKWCYDVQQFFPDDPPQNRRRNFSSSSWPYPGIVSMEVFKGKLFMNIGCQTGECHTLTAGELASYDYESGLLKTEAFQYSEQPFDWWNEGNGYLRVVGDLLINIGVDTKSKGTDLLEDPEVPGGCQIYQLTDGDGEWHIGITPSAGIFGVHIWDMAEFNGKLFIGRSAGGYYREMPTDFAGHNDPDSYNPGSWTPLIGTEHHEGDPDTPGQAHHRFMEYGNNFIVRYSDSWRYNGERFHMKKLLTYDQNLNQISETDTDSFAVGSDKPLGPDFEAYIIHNRRLITWNCRSGDIPEGAGWTPGGPGGDEFIDNTDSSEGSDGDQLMQRRDNLSHDLRQYWASRLYYTEQL